MTLIGAGLQAPAWALALAPGFRPVSAHFPANVARFHSRPQLLRNRFDSVKALEHGNSAVSSTPPGAGSLGPGAGFPIQPWHILCDTEDD